MRRLLLTPRWLALTTAMVALVIGFCVLGWWQAERALVDGNTRSFGYALEWPAFAIMVVIMYVKTFREELRTGRSRSEDIVPTPPRPASGRPGTSARAGVPSLAARETQPEPDVDDDPELAAYNRHLARLSARAGATT